MEIFDHDDVVVILLKKLETDGMSKTKWATENEVPSANVFRFLSGQEKPQAKLLKALGLKKKIVYVRV